MKRILFLLALPFISLIIFLTPVQSYANSSVGEACAGLSQLNNTGNPCHSNTSNSKVNSIAKDAINILSLIVGIASVIVIIIAGFRFITSNGDSNTVSSARTQLIYAIIGIVIVVIAQIISRIALSVGNKVAGIGIINLHLMVHLIHLV